MASLPDFQALISIKDRPLICPAGSQVQSGSPPGVVRWRTVATTTHQSTTIDVGEPGREVERAAEIFAHGERGEVPPQAIANLRMAIADLDRLARVQSASCRTRRGRRILHPHRGKACARC
jgi:hypothetical protein